MKIPLKKSEKSPKPIAIIIPCYDAERFLPLVLSSLIKGLSELSLSYEVVVVDNGSKDGSVKIAKDFGAAVEIREGVTIAALRNAGASMTTGELLVFLDADVEVTGNWTRTLDALLINYRNSPHFVTGAPVIRPPDGSWLERNWFNGDEFSLSHINTANLVTTRDLFTSLKGFDESLRTGEDWDFCSRAKKCGARIIVNRGFIAYHHGFPKNSREFFFREMWHGMGDFQRVQYLLRSKPALLALFNGIFFLVCAVSAIVFNSVSLLEIYLVFLFLVALTMGVKRSKHAWQILGNSYYSCLYLFARSISPLLLLLQSLRIARR